MPRKIQEQTIEIEITSHIVMVNGDRVRPGERVTVTAANARDLVAIGFARRITPPSYRDRAMRAADEII